MRNQRLQYRYSIPVYRYEKSYQYKYLYHGTYHGTKNPKKKLLEAFPKGVVGFPKAVMAFPSFPNAVVGLLSCISLIRQLSV